jgi:hypothetical protein
MPLTDWRHTVIELTAPPEDLDAGELGELPDTYDPEPIRTSVAKMVDFHKRFVYHPDESTHDVAVLWSITTHMMDLWRWHGRVYVTAPQPQCGKSTQADLLGFFAYKPLPVASTSAAGLFRAISHWSPTVLLDEADNQFGSTDDRRVLTAIVNEGAKRNGFVLRSERQRPVKHYVYGPLAFIGIDNGSLPEATQTRCIPIFMRRAHTANVETFDPLDHEDYQAEVQWRIAEFIDKVQRVTPTFDIGDAPITGRMRDIWTPLWSVAVALGGDWPERVATAAQVHQFTHVVSLEARILAATRDAFTDKPDDRMSSTSLANYVSGYDDIPTTSAKALHASMKAYGVLPSKSNGTMTYWRRDLEPVWAEWLTA